jgi:hypothetical protein
MLPHGSTPIEFIPGANFSLLGWSYVKVLSE